MTSLQSPIDLESGAPRPLPPLGFAYQRGRVDLTHAGVTLSVRCAEGSSIALEGRRYALGEFHFHTPAEHTVQGMRCEMEIHFKHKSEDGDTAAIAVLVLEGAQNEALGRLLDRMPTREGETKPPMGMDFDPGALLPAGRAHFRYDGSFTTPPYTEDVRWCVFTSPIEASARQMSLYRKLFAPNARPIQPTGDRDVVCSR